VAIPKTELLRLGFSGHNVRGLIVGWWICIVGTRLGLITPGLRSWEIEIEWGAVTRKCDLHPGSPIQTSTDGIAGCSMRDDVCQVMPDVPIYFLNRKVLWEFVGNGSMSSQLTEPGSDDVLELQSRYTDNNLMPW
jgi:hypothetical protein